MSQASRYGEGLVGRSGVPAPPNADADRQSVVCDGPAAAPSGPDSRRGEIDDIGLLSLDPTNERHEQKVEGYTRQNLSEFRSTQFLDTTRSCAATRLSAWLR